MDEQLKSNLESEIRTPKSTSTDTPVGKLTQSNLQETNTESIGVVVKPAHKVTERWIDRVYSFANGNKYFVVIVIFLGVIVNLLSIWLFIIPLFTQPTSIPTEDFLKKSHSAIDSLRAGQTLEFFKSKLGEPYSTNINSPWYLNSTPPQVLYEYIFKGNITKEASSTFYVQAVTLSTSDIVLFWSISICDQNTTFDLIDPNSKKIITLNKSTLSDTMSIADDSPPPSPYPAHPGSLSTKLYYFSKNIFETQKNIPGQDRLFVGYNNTCFNDRHTYFRYTNASNTPQYLQNVINDPNVKEFRKNILINIFGLGQSGDFRFYSYLPESDTQATVGVDCRETPDKKCL